MVGYKGGKLPFTYLGIPIGTSMSKERSWNCLYEKMSGKLSKWKTKLLSTGGKLTLCKTVLGSLGVYLFSIYKAPSKVLKKLESIRSKFFWGSSGDKAKIHRVAWDKVLNSRDKGGLGMGSLKAHNVALLVKWWWRFRSEEDTVWKKVVMAIHGVSGNLGQG